MSPILRTILYISLYTAILAVTINGQEEIRTLRVTGANMIESVHIDNRELTDLPNGGEWGATDSMNVDPYTRLVAIQGHNNLGGCSGILAAAFGFPPEYEFVSNSEWKCSSDPKPGWELLGFDDSDWTPAYPVGRNGEVVSGCSWTVIQNMPETAYWIWTEAFFDGHESVSCRGHTKVCEAMPCQNGGSCQLNSNQLCVCPVRYSGRFCETEINECDSNPCQNRGRCELTDEGYTCECDVPFTGTHCETDTSPCASNPCQNGATCHFVTDEEYHCACAPGYTGLDCEINIDECASKPCLNDGTCVDGVNSYTCNCVPGYEGDACQNDINECLPNPCLNAATCLDRVNDFQCACHPGYTGTLCETGVDECETNPCKNGGTCTLNGADGAVECICTPGWLDPLCGTNEDDCLVNPCQNGGTCIDGDGEFECRCTPIYQGPTCSQVIPNCGTIMAKSQYPPSNNFWILCEIDIVNHEPYLHTLCPDLIKGINYYNDSSTILSLGGNFGCYPSRYPNEIRNACFDNYNHDRTLASCLNCIVMGVCIRVP